MSVRPSPWILAFFCQVCFANAYSAELLDSANHDGANSPPALSSSSDNANKPVRRSGTPLHWAAFNGNESLVRSLLKSGANANDRLANGNTPLHLAAYKGHVAVVQVLLENGANAAARNQDGEKPADLARRNGHLVSADLLTGVPGQSRTAARPNPPPVASLRPTPRNRAPDSLSSAYRIQFVAVSSEERANRALVVYRDRFAGVLAGGHLQVEKVDRSTGPLYRVQYGPLSIDEAKTLCAEIKEREQPCLVKAAPIP